MRKALRIAGTLMIVSGLLSLGWAVLVWRWQDPVTAIYTHVEQGRLAKQLDLEFATFQPDEGEPASAEQTKQGSSKENASNAEHHPSFAAARSTIRADAAVYRRNLQRGDAVGRLTIGKIGVEAVIVQGTDHDSLKKGPGHYAGSYLPGQGQLIYIAGHRTTYSAPFSHIDRLRAGDWITVDLPYGTFKYVVTHHRIVPATDLAVLRSHNREVLVLQACHPRFFASHRYLVYARPAAMIPRGGATYELTPSRFAAARN